MTQTEFHHAKPVYEYLRRAGRATSPAAAPSTTSRPTPRPTCARSRRCPAPASGASASARAASRRSPSTTDRARPALTRRVCVDAPGTGRATVHPRTLVGVSRRHGSSRRRSRWSSASSRLTSSVHPGGRGEGPGAGRWRPPQGPGVRRVDALDHARDVVDVGADHGHRLQPVSSEEVVALGVATRRCGTSVDAAVVLPDHAGLRVEQVRGPQQLFVRGRRRACCTGAADVRRRGPRSGGAAARPGTGSSRGPTCSARRRRRTPGARGRVARKAVTRRSEVSARGAGHVDRDHELAVVGLARARGRAAPARATRPGRRRAPRARCRARPADGDAARVPARSWRSGERSGTGRTRPAPIDPVEVRRAQEPQRRPPGHGAGRAEAHGDVEDPLLDDVRGVRGSVVPAADRHPPAPAGLAAGGAGAAVGVESGRQHQSGREVARRGELVAHGPAPARRGCVTDAGRRRLWTKVRPSLAHECAWMQPWPSAREVPPRTLVRRSPA